MLASCTTTFLFYVNLFKELFLNSFTRGVSRLADAKVATFFAPSKFYCHFFTLFKKKVSRIDIYQSSKQTSPYYIILKGKQTPIKNKFQKTGQNPSTITCFLQEPVRLTP